MKKNSWRRTVRCVSVLLFAVLILSVSVIPAGALSAADTDLPYWSYTYWQDEYDNKLVPGKAMFKYRTTISATTLGIEPFAGLCDMCVGPDGFIYLMDSDNMVVTVVDNNGNFVKKLSTFYLDGKETTLTRPHGVFVSADNDLYVCDTEGERILVCDLDGNVSRVMTVPDSSLMPDDFFYRPLKVEVDADGYTYVLSDGSYYGAVFYNPNGEFVGFYGANAVETGIAAALQKLWEKLTMTNEKRAGSLKSLPYTFTDICIDKGGFVYTATGKVNSGSRADTIRRLSPGGVNILKPAYNYGEANVATKSDGGTIEQDIAGICVDEMGYVYAFDKALGNIYMYDEECNFIGAFGGGVGQGTQEGVFQLPCSIDYRDGLLYVCDSQKQNVTIFETTEYGKLLKECQRYTIDGDYDAAKAGWTKILAEDKNCRLAYIGLGRAALATGDYDAAMKYSRDGLDRDTYAQAYEKVRGIWLSEHFALVFIVIVLFVGLLIVGLVYKKKKGIVFIKNERVKLAATACFHPAAVFTDIRQKKNGSVICATVLLALYYISEVVRNDYYGYLFSTTDVSSFNSLVVLIRSVGAVLIFSVVNWAVCTLFIGRGKIKEIYIIVCYSLTYLIIANIVNTILSNFLLSTESSFMSILMTVAEICTVVVLAAGLIIIHEFSFGKFVGTTLLSILGLLLVVFLIAATIILVQQIYAFFGTVFFELIFR